MADRTTVQKLIPLLREFGNLERQRVGAGVTPLEYQRWLDLKTQMGRNFATGGSGSCARRSLRGAGDRPTRLRIAFKSRQALLDAIVENILPAGIFVPTPFAAATNTRFVACLELEDEQAKAEAPCRVVTSFVEDAHTLPSVEMGMGLKLERPIPAQAEGLSRLFDGLFDEALGIGSAS
jgi:hypothetical protein